MSAPHLPSELVDLIGRYELAFLVSIGDWGPHTTPQHPVLDSDRFHIAAPGPVTCRNIIANPAVTLLWPPHTPGGHVLIVDGHAALRDYTLEIVPTQAVLHHTGTADSMSRKCADCRRYNLAPPYMPSRTDQLPRTSRG
ncbi:pyridoxamine 5'-phosphate oxidase family protein [Nocardia sp. bgisy134]|uniref:pyridoxamine 5'-phosphate oxidase family protein n=1 Tax=Nocardia sp. bgisy134 TaxID=3413789 RepID=UPI003D71A072